MQINIPKKSIIMMIGPSNSGKSYFAKEILAKHFEDNNEDYRYLSSDDYRRDLLGKNLHKHEDRMNVASYHAFKMKLYDLDMYTQYPINVDYLIVDATHISKTGRQEVIDIAKRNAYNLVAIIFNYKEKDDYFRYVDEKTDKRIIFDMVKKMRLEVMKDLKRDDFDYIYKIDTIDFYTLDIKFTNEEKSIGYKETHKDLCFVGDIHGCYDEFLILLQDKKGIDINFETEDGIPEIVLNGEKYIHHVLIGDLVDKGPKVEELIRFIYKNQNYFTIVEGNHDRWNYNYLTGKIKHDAENAKLIENYFQSVELFKANEELKNMFFELYGKMYTYVYNDRFIATHAPCEDIYLGKNNKVASKKQNTIMYPKERDYETEELYLDAMEKFFKFLIDDSYFDFPYHIFGHVMVKNVFMNKNKVGIDTGCVAGGMLASALLLEDNKRIFIRKYPSQQPVTHKLRDLFRIRQNEFSFAGLDIDLQKRISFLAKNKVDFISGTMSPCDKNDFELESIWQGIKYYVDKGVNSIVLQKKYMGSRAQVYLHKTDVEKCQAISRNGYLITDSKLNSDKKLVDLFKELQEKYSYVFEMYNCNAILFDGELMPWNALGKSLIDNEFVAASKAINSEIEWMERYGFEEQFKLLAEKCSKPDEELSSTEKNIKNTYHNFKSEILPLNKLKEASAKYNHQLDIFNADSPIEFKPFAILKLYKTDGTEVNMLKSDDGSNIATYNFISNEPILVYDIKNQICYRCDSSGVLESHVFSEKVIEDFWKEITIEQECEGVVLKPDNMYLAGVAPFLKCRNPEYLRIVYGPDYDMLDVKKQRLIDKKSIVRKMKTSIKEYDLARELLSINKADISVDNPKWLSLIVQLISEQEGEKELDPRL